MADRGWWKWLTRRPATTRDAAFGALLAAAAVVVAGFLLGYDPNYYLMFAAVSSGTGFVLTVFSLRRKRPRMSPELPLTPGRPD